jgi:hypothetical protein
MDIVTAIFVSSVKILASVRLKGKNDNINIKIPTSDIFIHSIYMEAADQIWNEPFLFYHKPHPNKPASTQLCKASVVKIISDAIDRSFRQMLPLDDILQEYLANALNGEDSEEESEISEELNGDDIVSEYSNDSQEEFEDSEPEEPAPVKTFNFGNPPGEQFQPSGEQFQPPEPFPQQPPQPIQATTFDDLGDFNERPRSHSSSSSRSDSSYSSSSSKSSKSSSSSSRGSRHHRREENKHSFF